MCTYQFLTTVQTLTLISQWADHCSSPYPPPWADPAIIYTVPVPQSSEPSAVPVKIPTAHAPPSFLSVDDDDEFITRM